MGQRLGVAAALLGQPQTVVLDEPVNGLDPDGVRWIRLLLKSLAFFDLTRDETDYHATRLTGVTTGL